MEYVFTVLKVSIYALSLNSFSRFEIAVLKRAVIDLRPRIPFQTSLLSLMLLFRVIVSKLKRTLFVVSALARHFKIARL